MSGDNMVRMGTILVVVGLAWTSVGCAALTNPAADGIPVRRLPPEALGESKADLKPVPLSYLTPPSADAYRLAAGDVLGIYIEGILGERGGQPPVRVPEMGNQAPTIGYPIPVRDNGTLSLPLIEPIAVNGLTLEQAQDKITRAYLTPKKLLKEEGMPRIIVTLLRPRQYHVMVLREDTGGTTTGSAGGYNNAVGGTGTFVSQTRRAAGFPLDLPAYENDLLNALTRSGGLPGPEAMAEVLIIRGAYRSLPGGQPAPLPADTSAFDTIRVPMRLHTGEPFPVKQADLVLQSGDVVYVRARIGDIFYTGGLLPPKAFPLPYDRDIDVLEAIALVGGPILNGGIAANTLTGLIVQSGMGFPSPSLCTVVRKLKCGGQIPIVVNLNRAFKDPRERISIQPGDFIVLQDTPGEALGQYAITNLRLNFLGDLFQSKNGTGAITYTAP